MLLRNQQAVIKQFNTSEYNVYQTHQDKKYLFYFFNKTENQLDKIVKASGLKEKVNIVFSEIHGDQPGKINLVHNDIKLTIDLQTFNFK